MLIVAASRHGLHDMRPTICWLLVNIVYMPVSTMQAIAFQFTHTEQLSATSGAVVLLQPCGALLFAAGGMSQLPVQHCSCEPSQGWPGFGQSYCRHDLHGADASME